MAEVPGAAYDWRRMRRRAIPIALLLLAVVLTVSFANRSGDFFGYIRVGNLALAGRDVYRDARLTNTWPPLFALVCVPIALLANWSVVTARVLWLTLNWVALGWVLAMLVELVYRRRLALWPGEPRADRVDLASAAVLLPVLLSARWVSGNFEHLQINILIFALALYGLVLHTRGRPAASGLALGSAAALKVMPVLFVPYFVWRRQWRSAAWTAAATLTLSLVPMLVWGFDRFIDQLAAWRAAVAAGWSVGKMNLSVYAMLDRIVGHRLVPFAIPGINRLAPSGAPLVTVLAALLLGLVTLLAMMTFRGPYVAGSRETIAEWSVVFLVASVFGTVAWKAYLVVLLLPMTLFVATMRDPAVDPTFRRRLLALTWLTFALGVLATDVSRPFAGRMEMASLPTVMVLLMLFVLFWYRRHCEVGEEKVPAARFRATAARVHVAAAPANISELDDSQGSPRSTTHL